MRRDLSRGQSLRIQRQHDLVHIGKPPLPLLHDLRLERPVPVAGNIDADFTRRIGDNRLGAGPVAHIHRLAPRPSPVLLISQVLGELLVQRRFQNIFGEQLQQPIRAGQLQAPLPGLGHHRRRGGLFRRQLPPLVTLVTLVCIHSIRCHHSQCPSRRTSARRVGPETPFAAQSRHPVLEPVRSHRKLDGYSREVRSSRLGLSWSDGLWRRAAHGLSGRRPRLSWLLNGSSGGRLR